MGLPAGGRQAEKVRLRKSHVANMTFSEKESDWQAQRKFHGKRGPKGQSDFSEKKSDWQAQRKIHGLRGPKGPT